MHTTPVSLLEQVRNPGDQEAWKRFVNVYTPLLFHWAHRVGSRDQDAADLVQEVFLLLIQKLPEFTYDRDKSFRAWLRTLSLNRWHNYQRRKQLPSSREDQPNLSELVDPHGSEAFWDAEYRQHLVSQVLESIQKDFPPDTWKAWSEYVVRGRSATEVAAELGITINMVYLTKSRILRQLRRELDGLVD
jgi:RNA polymerase sigma-70 factor (ECF subfamily)